MKIENKIKRLHVELFAQQLRAITKCFKCDELIDNHSAEQYALCFSCGMDKAGY